MFGQTFYHETLRKYIIMFGNLFNDINVNRYDSNNNLVTNIRVPVNYGPRDKALSRIDQNPDLIPEYAMILPRMSFEMLAMNYAPTRKLNTVDRIAKKVNDASRLQFQYNPVPYDINMTLSIMVKNADDGAQILEQILPYFTPEWTSTMNLIPEMDFLTDIPVVLQSVSTEDVYEGSFETRRALIHTLDFIIKGYFYGPLKTAEVIREAQIDIGIPAANTQFLIDSQSGRPLLQSRGITDQEVGDTGRSSRITITPKIGGTTATATANLTSNSVNVVTITNKGSGYNNTVPTVTFSTPLGAGNTATGTAVLTANGNSVTSVTINNAGNNYGDSVTVTIAAPANQVSLADIDAADNFGFGIERNFYTDGRKYNPVTDSDE